MNAELAKLSKVLDTGCTLGAGRWRALNAAKGLQMTVTTRRASRAVAARSAPVVGCMKL
jgi:hypothetical protein